MSSSRKSLLAITSKAVLSLLAIDPDLPQLAQQKKTRAVRIIFDRDCCESFEVEGANPVHLACLDAWWQTTMDLYHFDLMLRRAYPTEVEQ
jgi:hypothetical protein